MSVSGTTTPTQPSGTPGPCPTPRSIGVREERYEVPCGSRYCGSCGFRWQGDQRVNAVAASEHLGGAVALITITAPGRRFFAAAADEWAGGEREAMAWWNDDARDWWRELHLWASRPLRRWASQHAPRWRLLFRSWEYQKRGALHLHLVLPYATPEERRVTELYVFNLWSGARQHRFGYVMGGESSARPTFARPPRVVPADGPAAARYVCKYVASTGAGKEGMVDVAQRTAQRGSVLYVAPMLQQASGVNITKLRARRRIYSRHPWARESHERWREACQIDAVQRGRAPLTRNTEESIREALRRTGAVFCVDAGTGEVLFPTVAPPPRQTPLTCGVRDRFGRGVALTLASVLLPDTERPELGETRTQLVRWEVV